MDTQRGGTAKGSARLVDRLKKLVVLPPNDAVRRVCHAGLIVGAAQMAPPGKI
jgi:hypothetical protein